MNKEKIKLEVYHIFEKREDFTDFEKDSKLEELLEQISFFPSSYFKKINLEQLIIESYVLYFNLDTNKRIAFLLGNLFAFITGSTNNQKQNQKQIELLHKIKINTELKEMLIKYSKDNKTFFEEGMQHYYYMNLEVRKIEEKDSFKEEFKTLFKDKELVKKITSDANFLYLQFKLLFPVDLKEVIYESYKQQELLNDEERISYILGYHLGSMHSVDITKENIKIVAKQYFPKELHSYINETIFLKGYHFAFHSAKKIEKQFIFQRLLVMEKLKLLTKEIGLSFNNVQMMCLIDIYDLLCYTKASDTELIEAFYCSYQYNPHLDMKARIAFMIGILIPKFNYENSDEELIEFGLESFNATDIQKNNSEVFKEGCIFIRSQLHPIENKLNYIISELYKEITKEEIKVELEEIKNVFLKFELLLESLCIKDGASVYKQFEEVFMDSYFTDFNLSIEERFYSILGAFWGILYELKSNDLEKELNNALKQLYRHFAFFHLDLIEFNHPQLISNLESGLFKNKEINLIRKM